MNRSSRPSRTCYYGSMKMFKRLILSLAVSLLAAGVLGLGLSTTQKMEVNKGFFFGQQVGQSPLPESGVYTIKRQGFPATYRETHTVNLRSGANTSYDSIPTSKLLAVINIVFWMSLLVVLLSPVAIFYRPKKHEPELEITHGEVKQADTEPRVQVKPVKK